MENNKWHRNRTRPRVVSFRMNDKEYGNLMEKVIDAGMNRQEFLIHMTQGFRIGSKEEAEEIIKLSAIAADIDRQLKGMATNLNQLAKVANSIGKLPDRERIKEMSEAVTAMRKEVNRLWEYLRQITTACHTVP